MSLKETELTWWMDAPVAFQTLNKCHDYPATGCRPKLPNRLPLHRFWARDFSESKIEVACLRIMSDPLTLLPFTILYDALFTPSVHLSLSSWRPPPYWRLPNGVSWRINSSLYTGAKQWKFKPWNIMTCNGRWGKLLHQLNMAITTAPRVWRSAALEQFPLPDHWKWLLYL